MAAASYDEDFEGGSNNTPLTQAQSHDGQLNSTWISGSSNVSTDVAKGGTKSYEMIAASIGIFQIEYNAAEYMTNFSAYIYGVTGTLYIYFYNQSHERKNISLAYATFNLSYVQSLVAFKIIVGSTTQYYDEYGTLRTIAGVPAASSWNFHLMFSIEDDTGLVHYKQDNGIETAGVACGSDCIAKGYRIDAVEMNPTGNYYFDNVAYVLSGSYGTHSGTDPLETFEGGIAGTSLTKAQSERGHISTYCHTGYLNVSSGTMKAGEKSLASGVSTGGVMYFDYSLASYLTNFSAYIYYPGAATLNLYFYNRSHERKNISFSPATWNASYSQSIITIHLASATLSYYDESGALRTINAAYPSSWANGHIMFNIEDNTGLVHYKSDTTAEVQGVACDSYAISQGYRIDAMAISSNGWFYFDNLNYTLSASYPAYAPTAAYETFEGGVAASPLTKTQSQNGQVSTSWIYGNTNVSSLSSKQDQRSYLFAPTSGGTMFFDYDLSSYITNFSAYVYGPGSASLWLYFYNRSHERKNISLSPATYNASYAQSMLSMLVAGYSVYYYDETGATRSIEAAFPHTWSGRIMFSIEDDTGLVHYKTDTHAEVSGVACNSYQFEEGYRIDAVAFASNGWFYMDNMAYTTSASYTPYVASKPYETFEGGAVSTGLSYTESECGQMATQYYSVHGVSGSKFNISNVNYKSVVGCKSLCIDGASGTGRGWINFSYPKTAYMTNWSTYTYHSNSNTYYLYFYNRTHDQHNVSPSNFTYDHSIIGLYISASNAYYFTSAGTNVLFGTPVVNNFGTSFSWEILNNTGGVSYKINDDTKVLTWVTEPSKIIANYRIDSIVVYVSNGDGSYLDDMNYTLSSDYTGTPTSANDPPVFGTPSPGDGSTGNPIALIWSVPITDPEGDTFDWTIQCNSGHSSSGTGVNGTKTCTLSGLLYSTSYTVWVNATDPLGSGAYTRDIMTFTTSSGLGYVYVSPSKVFTWYDHYHVHTIQEGIDNATAGRYVYVWGGTYIVENIKIDKAIHLVGNGSSISYVNYWNLTPSYNPIFSLGADDIDISGFHFNNSSTPGHMINDSAVVDHIHIHDNIFTKAHGDAIVIDGGGHSINISGNDFYYLDKYAISMDNQNFTCYDNTIADVVCGIKGDDGSYTEIARNFITTMQGSANIVLRLSNSTYNTVKLNTFIGPGWSGIYGKDIENCTIKTNYIMNFSTYEDQGIRLVSSPCNTIYDNYFDNRNNSWDDSHNKWNVTKAAGTNIMNGPYLGGNYWSDYIGSDTDGDGLGDTDLPYNSSKNITGVYGDFHPLLASVVFVDDNANSVWYNSIHVHTIQEGIANVTENGTIYVYAGTYGIFRTFINKSLSIIGNGSAWTSVQFVDLNAGFDFDPGFVIRADNVTISKMYMYWSDPKGSIINSSFGSPTVCNDTTVTNCTFSDAYRAVALGAGLGATHKHNINISDNIFTDITKEAILVNRSNTVDCRNNDMNDCGYGVYLNNCNASNVTGNYILRPTSQGISLVDLCVNGNVYNNELRNGLKSGIYCNVTVAGKVSASNCTFNRNYVVGFNTSGYGFEFGNITHYNDVYDNYFYNTKNAHDRGSTNTWNTTKTAGINKIGGSFIGGNYWGDYIGNDTDGDGLGNEFLPHNSSGYIFYGQGDYLPYTVTDPVIATLSPSGVNASNVTFRGSLSNLGTDVQASVWFDYGTTVAYGSTTTKTVEHAPATVKFNQGSLSYGTVYHYRADANNSWRTVNGSDVEFMTRPQVPFVFYTSDDATGIKLNWISESVGAGVSRNVYIRYKSGSAPTSRTDGNLLINQSTAADSDSYIAVGLNGTYGFSIWSYAYTASYHAFSWDYLTTTGSLGGVFNITVRYENWSQGFVNLSKYGPHKLIFYGSNTTQELNIFGTTTWGDLKLNLSAGTLKNQLKHGWLCLNFSSNLYQAEFRWNDSSNITNTVRCNRMQVAEEGNYNFTFYIMTNKTVYDGTATYVNQFYNRLVKWTYYFIDNTGEFLSKPGIDTYAYIYTYTPNGTRMMIHSEYLDTQSRIYPMLMYGKKYYVGIECNDAIVDKIGFAPTETDTSLTTLLYIIINMNSTAFDINNYIIKFDYSAGATGLYVYYYDPSLGVTSSWVRVYDYNNQSLMFSDTSTSSIKNFSFPGALHNRSYRIKLIINGSLEEINGVVSPGIAAKWSYATVNNELSTIFGFTPFKSYENPGDTSAVVPWADVLVFVVFMFLLFSIAGYNAALSGMVGGGWFVFAGVMLSGSPAIFVTIGVIILFMSFLYAWSENK